VTTLAEAAAQADDLAKQGGAERQLADLRTKWGDELEAAARSHDFRERAVAYRAIGQFRFRQKIELLRRGLEDESPAARGSALLSLELLSRDSPGFVNAVRPLLHELVNSDPNEAVRRLAVVCLRHGSPQRETIALLAALGEDDEQNRELRQAASKVSIELRKRAGPRG
jgi:HEAT repeat protein